MFRNYVRVALRNLYKYRFFSSINIVGLAASMSVCLLLIAFIRDQRSYDRFHDHSDQIYRITSEGTSAIGRPYHRATAPAPLAPTLATEYASVEQAVRLRGFGGTLRIDQAGVTLQGLYAEPNFWQVFSFPLIQGDPDAALTQPFSLVLTESQAKTVFGTADVMGQTVELEDIGVFTITGIAADLPQKTHMAFDVLTSFSTIERLDPASLNDWDETGAFFQYLQLRPYVSPEVVESQLAALMQQYRTPEARERDPVQLHLQALHTINLGADLDNQMAPLLSATALYVLLGLAGLILLIAAFNYTGLTVARSLKRVREIGVRKAAGATRAQLIAQFLGEAVVVALGAVGLAAIGLISMVPAFNELHLVQQLGIAITWEGIFDPVLILLFLGFAISVGCLAGLYPALRMSAQRPVAALGGQVGQHSKRSGFSWQKAWVTVQFVLSFFFAVTALVIYQQFALLLQAEHGLNEAHIVTVELQGVPYATWANEAQRHPDVMQVSGVSHVPGGGSNRGVYVRGDSIETPVLLFQYAVDETFTDVLGLTTQAGRFFDSAFASDQTTAVVISAKAVEALGFGSAQQAIGQVVRLDEEAPRLVIGVVENFYTRGAHVPYEPVMLHYDPTQFREAMVALAPNRVEGGIAALQEAWESLAPTVALNYRYYEDVLTERIRFFNDLIAITGLVAGFAMLIACLGLLGMVSYTTELRTKEVGMRKVLGASVTSLVFLLSKNYLVLIALAMGISGPLIWMTNHALLQSFPNRIALNGWYLLIGMGGLVVFALLVVGSQTIKAGRTNPVQTLHYD